MRLYSQVAFLPRSLCPEKLTASYLLLVSIRPLPLPIPSQGLDPASNYPAVEFLVVVLEDLMLRPWPSYCW